MPEFRSRLGIPEDHVIGYAMAFGKSAANVVVNYYISSDTNFNSGDTLIQTTKIKSISANSSKATAVRYSSSSSPTGKYLIAVVDPSNTIAEANEGNNQISANIP